MSVSSAYAYFTGQRVAPSGGDALGLNLPLQVATVTTTVPQQQIVLPRFLQDTYVPSTPVVSAQSTDPVLAQAQAIIARLEQRVAVLESQAARSTTVSTQAIIPGIPNGTPSTTYAPPRLPGQVVSSVPTYPAAYPTVATIPTVPGYPGSVAMPGQANTAIAQSVNQVAYTVNSLAQSAGVIGQSVANLAQAFRGIKF